MIQDSHNYQSTQHDQRAAPQPPPPTLWRFRWWIVKLPILAALGWFLLELLRVLVAAPEALKFLAVLVVTGIAFVLIAKSICKT